MSYQKTLRRCTPALLGLLLCPVALAHPAKAQTPPDPLNLLVGDLVKKGVLDPADAQAIIAAAQAQKAETAASPAPAPAPLPVPVPNEVVTSTSPNGTVHVTYIPPNVRRQIAKQVESQMLATEQAQGYGAPDQVPEWVHRLKFYGDIRTRYEGDLFPSGNDTAGDLPNFNAINTGNPYDISQANNNYPAQLNPNADRNRFRLRARLGVDADLGNGWLAGLRFATGENDSPVSENQTLGAANNAQGGNFSKYALWIDRAWIGYNLPAFDPNLTASLKFGRYDNPFFSTPLIWADDLGFDGVMAAASYKFDKGWANGLTPFLTLDASPVFNTDFNFVSNQPVKYSSEDKYLFAAQAGASYKFNDDYSAKLGLANYLFTGIQGKLSTPCLLITTADSCSTDDLRPSFAQNGNSYMVLRDIIPTSGTNGNNDGTTLQYQYFGLASRFDELALTGEFDADNIAPTGMWVTGEYVRNLAFHKADIAGKAVNNRDAVTTTNASASVSPNTVATYDGGDEGYFINLSVGQKVLAGQWDWNAFVGYRYIESDAVIDAFNDSDFGLGGTNLKGYTIGGNVALSSGVWVRLRYMSADNIVGPPYSVDAVQADLNAKF